MNTRHPGLGLSEAATIEALRRDLALQIARHVGHSGRRQVDVAKQLGIPQPTLSKIVNGRVSDLSLELLIRIAVRARLPVLLQTGEDPAEAGVYASAIVRLPRSDASRLAERAREDLARSERRLTPEQRLGVQLRHSELLTALHRAGKAHRAATATRRSGRTR
jgi:predicted XRE-type DNA-binding protein